MKKILFGLVAAGLATFFIGSAFANGAFARAPAVQTWGGPFVAVNGGWGYITSPEDKLFYGYTGEGAKYKAHNTFGSFIWGGDIGYLFDITPHMLLGVQVGYKNLGRTDYRASQSLPVSLFYPGGAAYDVHKRISQQAIDALISARYFVWKGLNLVAGAGVAYVDSTSRVEFNGWNYPNPSISHIKNVDKQSIWRMQPEIMLGAGYTWRNGVGLHLLYNHICGYHSADWGNSASAAVLANSNNGVVPTHHVNVARVYGANMLLASISFTFGHL